ncbi:MAG: aminotransferase class IV [Clostridiaceae bacterium]|nr:aminotransferase class IV [Clostridiaceae bacterium]
MYVLINEKLQREEDNCIAASSLGFTYGYGLFETMKFKDGKIYFLQEHMERFKDGCKKLNLFIDFDIDKIEGYCRQVMDANALKVGALKVLYARGNDKNYLVVSVREDKYRKEDYDRGFKLAFTNIKRNPYSPLTYIKSNNYMENLIARKSVLDNGYDEVLFENVEGNLCEGAISNIFFIKNTIVYTPSIDCGILPGIMRKKIIEVVEALDLKLEVGKYTRKDLLQAEEVFLTNSLMEIMPVSEIQDRKLSIKRNSITEEISKAYIQYLQKK